MTGSWAVLHARSEAFEGIQTDLHKLPHVLSTPLPSLPLFPSDTHLPVTPISCAASSGSSKSRKKKPSTQHAARQACLHHQLPDTTCCNTQTRITTGTRSQPPPPLDVTQSTHAASHPSLYPPSQTQGTCSFGHSDRSSKRYRRPSLRPVRASSCGMRMRPN